MFDVLHKNIKSLIRIHNQQNLHIKILNKNINKDRKRDHLHVIF